MENDASNADLNSAESGVQSGADEAKIKILLAEDDAAMRRLIEVVLQRAGYAVVSAEDGLQAMQAAGTAKFDLAVIDAIMPNLSGYELCRIFRSHPDYQHIRLVLMSGMEVESIGEADAHLLKSARLQEEILETVSNLLGADSV